MVYVEEYNGNPQAEFDELTKTVKKTSVLSSKWSNFSTGFIALFSSVFLPQGYPYTVTSDYLQYQIWDTIQAFASSLSGALSTSAVLRGVGVGNESATVLAASLTWLLKDGTGMVGRIIFAWAKGSALDSDCKRWRLVADILNDLAFFIELLSPHLPRIFFAPLACAASLFRSIVGVAGGATRTAITRHQARRENLADVAAKDGSQETLVNVFSLIISLILLPLVDGRPELVWTLFVLFTGVHLGANYRAVRALHLDTLNQSRLAIAVRQFIADRTVPKISEANEREPLFEQVTGPRH
uniref:RUS family member 1 n=1 Tax=Acrobeloides nanus TaxID=290746 RepID=A0A914CSE8_9BILA